MPFKTKYDFSKKQLTEAYEQNGCLDGARLLGLSCTHFHRLLKQFDIPRRTQSEARKLLISRKSVEERRRMTRFCRLKEPWNKGLKNFMIPWNKGQHGLISQETRRKISEGTRKGMSRPEVKKKVRQHRLSQVFPRKDTIIERKLQKELNLRGLVFETHKPVLGICQPDIVFPEKHIAVFADGHYWHKVHEGAGAKDTFQTMMLCANDWKVLRFSDHQIKVDVKGCVDVIEKTVSQCERLLGE